MESYGLRGVCLPTLNQKLRVSQALGHWFCESSNSEDKDRCLSFYLWVCLWTLTGFCAVCLCAHCILHSKPLSVLFVVNITHHQCQSHILVSNSKNKCTSRLYHYLLCFVHGVMETCCEKWEQVIIWIGFYIKELKVISVAHQVSLLMLI